MKLSEFYSEKGSQRPQKTQILAFNNEAKEAQMTSQIATLQAKVALLERIEEEKAHIQGRFSTQQAENQRLIEELKDSHDSISNLEAQLLTKQRLEDDNVAFRHSNDQLLVAQGEMTAQLTELSTVSSSQAQKLAQLEINNASLEINKQTLYNEGLQKDTLLQEMKKALEELKQKHETLTTTSEKLSQDYTELAEDRSSLQKINKTLQEETKVLQNKHDQLIDQSSAVVAKHSKATETRTRNKMNKQIEELQQDVEELLKVNAYYKNELNKPQHLSIGAIARQEGFKIPLASSAINYRKNNLGTGQATLLKFGKKENN